MTTAVRKKVVLPQDIVIGKNILIFIPTSARGISEEYSGVLWINKWFHGLFFSHPMMLLRCELWSHCGETCEKCGVFASSLKCFHTAPTKLKKVEKDHPEIRGKFACFLSRNSPSGFSTFCIACHKKDIHVDDRKSDFETKKDVRMGVVIPSKEMFYGRWSDYKRHMNLCHKKESKKKKKKIAKGIIDQMTLDGFFARDENKNFHIVISPGVLEYHISDDLMRILRLKFSTSLIRCATETSLNHQKDLEVISVIGSTKEKEPPKEGYQSIEFARESTITNGCEIHEYNMFGARSSEHVASNSDDTTTDSKDPLQAVQLKYIDGMTNFPKIACLGIVSGFGEDFTLSDPETQKATAIKCLNNIKTLFHENGLSFKRNVGFASDTTSKMSGKTGGVIGLINNDTSIDASEFENPFWEDGGHVSALSFNCIMDMAEVKKVTKVLKILARHFTPKQSIKRLHLLKEVTSRLRIAAKPIFRDNETFILNEELMLAQFAQFVKPKRVENLTRHWDGLRSALEVLVRMKEPIVLYAHEKLSQLSNLRLQSEIRKTKTEKSELSSLYDYLTNYQNLHFIHCLLDILEVKTNGLDKPCQRPLVSESDVNYAVGRTIETYKAYLSSHIEKNEGMYRSGKLIGTGPQGNPEYPVLIGKCSTDHLKSFVVRFLASENNLTYYHLFEKKKGTLSYEKIDILIKKNSETFRKEIEKRETEMLIKIIFSLTERFVSKNGFLSVFNLRNFYVLFHGRDEDESGKFWIENMKKIVDYMNIKMPKANFQRSYEEFTEFVTSSREYGLPETVKLLYRCWVRGDPNRAYENFVKAVLDICDRIGTREFGKIFRYTHSHLRQSASLEGLFGIAKRMMDGRESLGVDTLEAEIHCVLYRRQFDCIEDCLIHFKESGMLFKSIKRWLGMKKRNLGVLLKEDAKKKKLKKSFSNWNGFM